MKNKIKWVGNTDNSNLEQEINDLQKELEDLEKDDKDVDYWIESLQDTLTGLAKEEANTNYAYVNFDDIKSLNAINKEDNNPFLVIKAPKGTTLEVPTGDNSNTGEDQYQLFLKSHESEITVYVVSADGEKLSKVH